MTHRAATPRLQINARLVKEKDRARARELRRLLLYGAAIVVPLLVYVWQRVEFLAASYEVEAFKKERETLQERNKQLTVERSFLLSPDRIERLARREIGLVDPAPSDVRRVAVIDGRIDAAGAKTGADDASRPAAPKTTAASAATPAPRRAAPRARRRAAPVPRATPATDAGTQAIEAGVGILPGAVVPAPDKPSDPQAP